MKKNVCFKTLCCLLAVCLLSGCAPKSSLLAHADDDTGLLKTEMLVVLTRFSSVKNAEGKELRWFSDFEVPSNFTFEPEGDMEYRNPNVTRMRALLCVPFSTSITADTIHKNFPDDAADESERKWENIWKEQNVNSGVTFYSEDATVSQSAYGRWNRAVHHCNNVIEIYGNLSDFGVRFVVQKKFPEGEERRKEDSYILEGSGKDHIVIALADDEILTEGMTKNYTVRHSNQTGDKVTEIVKKYDKDGNLLSTTEE